LREGGKGRIEIKGRKEESRKKGGGMEKGKGRIEVGKEAAEKGRRKDRKCGWEKD
jgi:hypothetical protein